MKKMAEKLMKKAQQQSQYRNGQGTFYYQTFGGQREQNPKSDGKVKVDYVPPKEEERKGPSTAGEFIDFEEVK